jgi:hypothetical protein
MLASWRGIAGGRVCLPFDRNQAVKLGSPRSFLTGWGFHFFAHVSGAGTKFTRQRDSMCAFRLISVEDRMLLRSFSCWNCEQTKSISQNFYLISSAGFLSSITRKFYNSACAWSDWMESGDVTSGNLGSRNTGDLRSCCLERYTGLRGYADNIIDGALFLNRADCTSTLRGAAAWPLAARARQSEHIRRTRAAVDSAA